MFDILKDFLYSTDGVTAVLYSTGDTQPVIDDLAPGLLKEKFIKAVK